MWVTPRPTVGVSVLWNVEEENTFFALLEHRTATSRFASSVVGIVRRVGQAATGDGSSPQPLRFRIILKDEEHHAVAVSDDLEDIKKRWQWINVNIIPKVSMQEDERSDMLKYLLDKFQSLSKEDEAREGSLTQETVHAFITRFGLHSEVLVASYYCSIWRNTSIVGTHRHGTMWITENYICFNSPFLQSNIVIPLRTVTNISKESSHFGVLSSSIAISTKDDEEYYFSTFWNRDLVFELLSQLWDKSMAKLLLASNSNTQAALSPDLNPPSSARLAQLLYPTQQQIISPPATKIDPRKRGDPTAPPADMKRAASFTDRTAEILRTSRIHSILQLFRLNPKEAPEKEIGCSLYMLESYMRGNMYYSESFLYFTTLQYPLILAIFPFVNIVGISKDNPYISAITIIVSQSSMFNSQTDEIATASRDFTFSFVGHSNASELMSSIIAKWKQVIHVERTVRGQPTSVSGEKQELEKEMKELSMASVSIEKEKAGEQKWTPAGPVDGPRLRTDVQPRINYWDPRTLEAESHQEKLLAVEWELYFKEYGQGLVMLQMPYLRNMVRRGIPQRLRAGLWQVLSGAAYNQLSNQGMYKDLLVTYKDAVSEVMEEIERDLHRSLPEDAKFQTPEGLNMLRNVLRSFAWYNRRIGYCQGMNIIAAHLLTFMGEEETFYIIDALCSYLVPQYYEKEMLGSLVDQQILEDLVRTFLPKIAEHFEKSCIPLSLITLPWLLCLFIGHMRLDACQRVLDCFFYEGPNVLFSLSLAILKLNQEKILNAEYNDTVVDYLKTWIFSNAELIFAVAFTEFDELPEKHINEMRNKHKYKAIMQLEDNSKKKQFELMAHKTLFSEEELESLYALFQDQLPASQLNTAEEDVGVDLTAFQPLFNSILYFWKGRMDLMELTYQYLERLGGNRGFVTFKDLMLGVSPLCRGELKDKLLFCLKIHDLKEEGAINAGSLYNALDALLQIYSDEDEDDQRYFTREDRAKKELGKKVDLDAFVMLIFEKTRTGGSPMPTQRNVAAIVQSSQFDRLSFEVLEEVLLDTPLLAQLIAIQPNQNPVWTPKFLGTISSAPKRKREMVLGLVAK